MPRGSRVGAGWLPDWLQIRRQDGRPWQRQCPLCACCWRWLRRWLLAIAAIVLSGNAPAADAPPPGVFLKGATVPRAKALALDAAMLRGWHVAASGRDHSLFETILEEPASPGPLDDRLPPERTLLRIRADFIATPAGVNAYLRAEEVWWAGAIREWRTDVTEPYRANLMRALNSLERQWVEVYRQRPGTVPRTPRVRVETEGLQSPSATGLPAETETSEGAPAVRVAPLPVTADADATAPPDDTGAAMPPSLTPDQAPDQAPASGPPLMLDPAAETTPAPEPAPQQYAVGIWAYYAEQSARERGCEPADWGAVLIGDGGGASELHRVYCADGSTLVVRCDRERCRDGQSAALPSR